MIGVYVVWKKVKNWVISTPTWYVVCEINNMFKHMEMS